ncbi:MAG: hypothetical protein AAGA10_21765 [Bacteroidota bacterium]
MKVLLPLIIIVCLAACTPSPTTTTVEAPPKENETPQWIHYPGKAGDGAGKHIVFISGDEEYRSEEALPMLGRILADHHGFDCTILFAQHPDTPGIVNPNYLNHIPGLDELEDADLAFMFTRFRELPDAQMQHIDNFLKGGKPIIGIRTATHAFNIKDTTSQWMHYSNFYAKEGDPWDGGFGRAILGEKWVSHHGHHKHQSTRGLPAPGNESHPILSGIEAGAIWGPTDVYGVRLPLPGDSEPIVLGQVVDRPGEFDEEDLFYGMRPEDTEIAGIDPEKPEKGNPNDPMMPIAWTKSYEVPGGEQGKAFASTIGSSTDLLNEGVRRMYVNAVHYLLGMEVPEAANVEIVGAYNPTPYEFRSDNYWTDKQMQVAAYQP